MAIDQVQLNFNPASLMFINWMLAIVMFGVALDLRVADFKRVFKQPKAPAIGLLCQFLLMPALACLLVFVLTPPPSVALGIILVSACPGGNVSNFFTSFAKGNAAVSVSMSAVSTLVSIVMTPFNFMFWGQINPHTRPLIQQIELMPSDILGTVLSILVLPTVLGMALAAYKPGWARRLIKPMRWFSLLTFVGFIAAASAANYQHFISYIGSAFGIVFLVNGTALALGYGMACWAQIAAADARAVCFETGIQNSGFGLVLVFQFFAGLGGMAIIVAWWGVWHLISGLLLALYWSKRPAIKPLTGVGVPAKA